MESITDYKERNVIKVKDEKKQDVLLVKFRIRTEKLHLIRQLSCSGSDTISNRSLLSNSSLNLRCGEAHDEEAFFCLVISILKENALQKLKIVFNSYARDAPGKPLSQIEVSKSPLVIWFPTDYTPHCFLHFVELLERGRTKAQKAPIRITRVFHYFHALCKSHSIGQLSQPGPHHGEEEPEEELDELPIEQESIVNK